MQNYLSLSLMRSSKQNPLHMDAVFSPNFDTCVPHDSIF